MTKPPANRPASLEVLSNSRGFRDIDREPLAALVDCADIVTLEAGDNLYRAGDPYEGKIYILFAGTLRMDRVTGERLDVQIGDFLGLANYLDNAPYASTVQAVSDCALLVLTGEQLKILEREYPQLFNALNRIIAFKLRKRSPERGVSGLLAQPVTAIMKAPVVSCHFDNSLWATFETMRERKIGCMVVTDDEGLLEGVVTFATLAESILEGGADPEAPILATACRSPHTVEPDTPVWQAEAIQHREGAKHLIVVEDRRPIGMVSQTNLLRTLISRPGALSRQIPRAGTFKELSALHGRIVEAAADARQNNRLPSTAVRILSETHLAIQQRVIELTLEWMEGKGYGKPPLRFAVLIMGSGGRKEMLLTPDQDNGLIIEDSSDNERPEVKEWFARFGKRMNRNLDRVGYILCPGGIMARNPTYSKSLDEWKRQLSHIAERPTEKAARWSNIMFDFDTLYGDDSLALELRRHLFREVKRRPRLLRMMAEHDAEGRPAIGFFNRLITTRSESVEVVDIKRNGLRIIGDAARIFALQNGIAVQNTIDRLQGLMRAGRLSNDFCAALQEAYEGLLDLLLSHQIEQAQSGTPPDKLIAPERLTDQSRGVLRMAMWTVKRYQEHLQDEFETEIF